MQPSVDAVPGVLPSDLSDLLKATSDAVSDQGLYIVSIHGHVENNMFVLRLLTNNCEMYTIGIRTEGDENAA